MCADPSRPPGRGDVAKTGGPLTKLTATTRRAVVKAISDGLPRKFAAEVAGVSERCLYKWLAAGRKGESPEAVQLVQDLKKARAKGVAARLARITKAASKGAWQADAWVLERTHPEHFASERRELAELRREVKRLAELVGADREGGDAAAGSSAAHRNGPPPPRDAVRDD